MSEYNWKDLDEVIRKWAALSSFERDLAYYNSLKREVDAK